MVKKAKKILVVVDNPELDWRKQLAGKQGKYCLLTIGFLPDSCGKDEQAMVPTKELSLKAENEARKSYLDSIRDLPDQNINGRSLLDVLSFGDRNLWWYLAITEKSIWLDRSVHRLYGLFRFKHVCAENSYDEVVLLVGDPLLRGAMVELLQKKNINRRAARPSNPVFFALQYYYRVCRKFVDVLVQLVFLRSVRAAAERKILPGSIGFFTIFPTWWKAPFSSGARELFFQSIPDDLTNKENMRYLVWLLEWKRLLSNREGLKEFLKDPRVIVLQRFLRLPDLLSLFSFKRFWRILQAYRLSSQVRFEAGGVDVSEFYRESLRSSLINSTLHEWSLLDRVLQHLPLKDFKAVLFRLEFQPLERALLYSTRRRTKSIGFQHSAIGPNFLNYVFGKGELGEHWKGRGSANSLPLPDLIFTSGRLGHDYMSTAGYPRDRLAVSGGVRYSFLSEYLKGHSAKSRLRTKYSLPVAKKIVLIPTSQLLNETLGMLNTLLLSVSDAPGDFHFIVKGNPNKEQDPAFVQKIASSFEESSIRPSYQIFNEDIPLYDYISASDAVLLTGGTAALEAMALGVIPIIYICPPQFSHNPMVQYPEAVFLVDNVRSMRSALLRISNGSLADLKRHWGKPLEDMFGDVSDGPNERFIKLFKEREAIPSQ